MDRLPRECFCLIVQMAFLREDYWSFADFVRTLAGVRCMCRTFAYGLIWSDISANIRDEFRDDLESTITKTEAKQDFRLNDKDLTKLPCSERRNPYYRCAPPMKIYYVRDIVTAAKEKHGSKRLMDEKVAKRKEASNKRRRTIEAVKQKRYDELVNKLGQHGLPLREDSRLCEEYIERGVGNIDHIVETMIEMNFYFQHTDYRQIYREVWRREKSFSGWADADDVSEMAKYDALRQFASGLSECPDYVPASLRSDVQSLVYQ